VCGIGLYWAREKISYDTIEKMMEWTERRGTDALGMAIINPKNDRVRQFFSLNLYPSTKTQVKNFLMNLGVGSILLWNNRAKPMTEVESTDLQSVQPIRYIDEKLVLVHNGVVANEDDLKKFGYPKRTKIDSEYFLHAYLKYGRNSKLAVETVVGGSAYILWDGLRERLILIKDFKPLATAYKKGVGFFAMSDIEGFKEIFQHEVKAVWEDFYYGELDPYVIDEIDINTGLIDRFNFQPNYISSLPQPNPNKVIVMASGGVDSSVAATIAKKLYGMSVILVHFNFGQKSEKGEMKAVKYLSDHLGSELIMLDFRWLGEIGNSVLTDKNLDVPKSKHRENLKSTICWTPARNLVFATTLMAIAEAKGASRIYNGWTLEESGSYPDNSLNFFKTLNEVSLYGTLSHPKVVMVEQNLMKPEIIFLGKHLGLDFSRLWSCDSYSPEGECGECGACWLKQTAIHNYETKNYDLDLIKRKLVR